jgi:hypothetical protein
MLHPLIIRIRDNYENNMLGTKTFGKAFHMGFL